VVIGKTDEIVLYIPPLALVTPQGVSALGSKRALDASDVRIGPSGPYLSGSSCSIRQATASVVLIREI